MTKTLIFLSYFSCLAFAVVFSFKQTPVDTASVYIIKQKTDDVQQIQPDSNIILASNINIAASPDEDYAVDEIIGMPDAPQTNEFSPGMIDDFKTADPAEGISLISAPSANSMGSAVLTFNMKLPAGRLGMEPDLSIQYNSDGGTSWLGYGWNMSTASIGIETRWGVPRYDAALETEIYTLNGEQLAPVNNRAELVARTAEKQFYPRVEGSFSKIIRHGSNPANYWWEITEKNGIRNFYGGRPGTGVVNNAVLKDDQNNIASWVLVERREPSDNFVRYVYQTVEDAGVEGGTVTGKQLYLSQILYTGSGTTDGAYKVEFTRDRQLDEPKRKDIAIDARLGFKMVTADLLRRVTISFNNTPIRSYEYTYEEGAFYKTILKSISEIDNAGNIFYTHNFEYYDDVNKAAGYNPSSGVTTWTIGNDDIKGDLLNPIPGFTAEGSALSTSKADSRSGGVAVTIGSLAGGAWSKRLSVGGSFNYGNDYQVGLLAMIDINGDGLPDKVFRKGNNLFYRANLGTGSHSFGDSRPITGAYVFSSSESENIGGGVQVIPASGFLGYNHTRTTTKSKVYFSDFNGDGLMDIATDGRVLFNHLNAQGDPDFVTNSGLTPSPILEGAIDNNFFTIDTALQSQQERDFPLQDIIRMWEAPSAGTVTLTAPVQLLEIPNQSGLVNDKKDGVRASIQLRGTQLWSTVIPPDDYSVKTPANVSNLVVAKGDRIYFRLQSIYNGEDDLVKWDPVIQYQAAVTVQSDRHHKVSNYYKASADYVLHSKSAVGMGKTGSITIDGNFKKNIASDSVWIMVTRTRASVTTTIFETGYSGTELFDGDLLVPGQLPVLEADELHFLLFSKSYIDRSVMQWKPHYEYVSFADATPVTSTTGEPTMHGYPVPDNSNYNKWLIAVPPVSVTQQDTVIIWPQVSGNGNANGRLWFSIKGTDTIYARRHVLVTNGVMDTLMDSIHLVRKINEPLFFEFAADTMEFALNLQPPLVAVYCDSIFVDSVGLDTVRVVRTMPANLYSNPAQEFLGPLFRGWGQFAFKGDKGDGPLDETKLNLDELNDYPTDPNDYMDSTAMGDIKDPSKADFIALFSDPQKQFWVGYDTAVYVSDSNMSSSRLWLHDVSVDSLMSGGSAGAVHKVSTTKTNSFSAGISPGLSGSAGTSFATTVVNLDMMDMNGDNYPDVLNDEMIQYTLPHGGLGATVISQPIGETENEGFSAGLSLGGSFIEATTENSTKKGAVAAQKTAKNSSGLSGSVNMNEDDALSSWIDINGDGLTDRIYSSGVVSLNLGYRFAPGEQWGTGGIDASTSYSAGAGLGVNIDAGSFEAGFGLSRTVANNSFMLGDINGDGLPDQYSMSGSDLVVKLNQGNGFGASFVWRTFNNITSNVSTGESINAAFTIPIIIPIPFFPLKICINPTVNIGHGVSMTEAMIMDIDGDGVADMLHSSNDGHLTASASTIGRTNMLKKVTGPLGGYFSMDYERVGNTYEMPQSKWILKSVEVFDGVAGDGIDTTRQQFSYEGGYHDRHEREFYGFSRVITRDLNTADHNLVYRSRVQQFLNTSYYNKGLLASEWLEDAAGKKFTQINNLYDISNLRDQVEHPRLRRLEKLFYEGGATFGARTVKEYEYDALGNVTRISDDGDGSQQDMIITDITYHSIDNLYIKSVPATIEINTAEGVRRRTITSINGSGSVTRVRQVLADGTVADTDVEYDNYSNVIKLTRPVNYKGQRMWYSYEYDNAVHTYVTRVTDAFGYTSTSTYDYRFGMLTGTVSMNNEEVRYTLDNRGRILTLTGPYEIAAGRPYSITYSYHPGIGNAYAVTRRYDPEHNADVRTVNFSDGLGRNVQVKKQVSLFKGKNIADEIRMVVSGSDLFDPYGRVESSYYPITETIGANNFILNTGTGAFKSSTTHDVLDRALGTELADGAATSIEYSIANGMFSMMVTDALNNWKEILTDVRERKRFINEFGPAGTITTRFDYNALSELVRVTDHNGNIATSSYDNLGRKLSEEHPDAGHTDYIYDAAGNMLKKITAQIKKEIPNGGAIQYQYDFERLTDIDYPRHYQNKVKYEYGKAGTGSKAGRLTLQMDATGGQEFFYGPQGEIIKTIRTVLVNPVFSTTYVSEQQYDSWNRVKKIVYPDGEEVNYHYNRSGALFSMDGNKKGHTYKYVDQLGYDEYDERIYLRYGNGAETNYTYDIQRRRLNQLKAVTASGHQFMNNEYSYDAVSNVLEIINNGQAQNGKLGGYAKQNLHYDNLYRLDSASGEYSGSQSSSYAVKLSYDNLYNIVQKTMDDAAGQRYDQAYTYDGDGPHQATAIGANQYSYDENGNQLGYGDMENFWDEEDRLIGVLNKGVLSQYTYDADGERVIKSSGGLQGLWINGAPAGAVRHSDNYTVYVNQYITCRKSSFIKHYYIGNERIATKQGHGRFTNISFPQPGLTAGGVDYAKRAAQIERARIAYYASLGVSPGPPTDKNYWARPENSGIPAPVFVDSTATNVPPGWPGNTTPPPNGPPIFVNPIPSNDSVKAGYGFQDPAHLYEASQHYYHPDHLGSTSYVTNTLGEASQHIEYAPFGETFVEEYSSSFRTSYLYNGKGRDEETGYYKYDSRYYEPVISQWLSADGSIDRMGGYGISKLRQEVGAGSYSTGAAAASEIAFGDDAAGMTLSAFGVMGDEGDGGGDGKGKPKKSGGDKAPMNSAKPKPGTNRSNNSGNQARNIGNMKRAFRQVGNALGNNAMFFNHVLKRNPNENNNNSKPRFYGTPRTRPRR